MSPRAAKKVARQVVPKIRKTLNMKCFYLKHELSLMSILPHLQDYARKSLNATYVTRNLERKSIWQNMNKIPFEKNSNVICVGMNLLVKKVSGTNEIYPFWCVKKPFNMCSVSIGTRKVSPCKHCDKLFTVRRRLETLCKKFHKRIWIWLYSVVNVKNNYSLVKMPWQKYTWMSDI